MTRMNYSLEKRALDLLEEFLADQMLLKPPIRNDLLCDKAEELLAKILEDAQEQAKLQPYRDAVMDKQIEGHLEIDSDAIVSIANPPDNGAYVAAWLWVTNREAGLPDEDDEPVVDVCIAGNPAVNGKCGDPDCVCETGAGGAGNG